MAYNVRLLEQEEVQQQAQQQAQLRGLQQQVVYQARQSRRKRGQKNGIEGVTAGLCPVDRLLPLRLLLPLPVHLLLRQWLRLMGRAMPDVGRQTLDADARRLHSTYADRAPTTRFLHSHSRPRSQIVRLPSELGCSRLR